MLAIGTFGNKQLEEEAVENSSANVQATQDPAKFTEEEVDNIQREFEVLLQGNGQAEAQGSYEDEQVASKEHDGEDNNEKQRREQLMNREMIISKAREIVGKKRSAKLKPRSMASLLRLLACKGGFTTPVLEPRNSFPQTRMEKVQPNSSLNFLAAYQSLRLLYLHLVHILAMWLSLQLLKAILQKKIHPQNSNTVATRRHLDWKLDEKEINECLEDALRDLDDDDDDGAKWVKTDSDCKYYKSLAKFYVSHALHISFTWDSICVLFSCFFSYCA